MKPANVLFLCASVLLLISLFTVVVLVPNLAKWQRISSQIARTLSSASISYENNIVKTSLYWTSAYTICGCTILINTLYAIGVCCLLQVMRRITRQAVDSSGESHLLNKRLASIFNATSLFATGYSFLLILLWLVLHGRARQVFHACMKCLYEKAGDITAVSATVPMYLLTNKAVAIIGSTCAVIVAALSVRFCVAIRKAEQRIPLS